jgi:hypothetical protein
MPSLKRSRVRVLAEIGDFFSIQLPDERIAYGQYVAYHELYGTMIQVLDLIEEVQQPFDRVVLAKPLFPPVFVGLNVPLREKLWQIVGNRPLRDFCFPLFRSTRLITHGLEPGIFEDWAIWDGKNYTFIGKLRDEYRWLEYLVCWASDALEERIATGNNFYNTML